MAQRALVAFAVAAWLVLALLAQESSPRNLALQSVKAWRLRDQRYRPSVHPANCRIGRTSDADISHLQLGFERDRSDQRQAALPCSGEVARDQPQVLPCGSAGQPHWHSKSFPVARGNDRVRGE